MQELEEYDLLMQKQEQENNNNLQIDNSQVDVISNNNLNEMGDTNFDHQVQSSLNITKDNKLNEAFVFENYSVNDSAYQNNSQNNSINNSKNNSNSFLFKSFKNKS